jgi:hypothetical protein
LPNAKTRQHTCVYVQKAGYVTAEESVNPVILGGRSAPLGLFPEMILGRFICSAVNAPAFSVSIAAPKNAATIFARPNTKHNGLMEFAARGYLLLDATYTPVNIRASPSVRNKAAAAQIIQDLPLINGNLSIAFPSNGQQPRFRKMVQQALESAQMPRR